MEGAAFFSVALVKLNLYGESCPGKQGQTPSLVNLSERLYEEKDDHFNRAKS